MGTINSAFSLISGALDADQSALSIVANNVANANAPSTTQFCRQCHFGEANEANNTNGITTVFQ